MAFHHAAAARANSCSLAVGTLEPAEIFDQELENRKRSVCSLMYDSCFDCLVSTVEIPLFGIYYHHGSKHNLEYCLMSMCAIASNNADSCVLHVLSSRRPQRMLNLYEPI
jgi:hypothetical protein